MKTIRIGDYIISIDEIAYVEYDTLQGYVGCGINVYLKQPKVSGSTSKYYSFRAVNLDEQAARKELDRIQAEINGNTEQQTPEKPYMQSDGYADGYPVWDYYCPECNYEFEDNVFNYCPKCGQAIDWSDR